MDRGLAFFALACVALTAGTRTVDIQDLVKDPRCILFTLHHAECSWAPAGPAAGLEFFYWLQNDDGTVSINDPPPPLQNCSSYHSDGSRTACDLQGHANQIILFFFKGMLNNEPVTTKNSSSIYFELRPPPLKWTIYKTKDAFNISWIHPDILPLHRWNFVIVYTECNKRKNQTIEGLTSYRLPMVSHCQYHIAIKAHNTGERKAETPMSEEKFFDADTDLNAPVYAAIFIPLMFAGLAALTFVCCRKNKKNIFPKVPEPRDLLSDISDNNNKSTVHNLYVPAEEEENCKITLVIDPQIN